MLLKVHGRRPFRAAFSFVGREAPGRDLRPLPPGLCTWDHCSPQSAAISMRAAPAHAGWCASKISTLHASFRDVPTRCCARSKRSASSGMAKSCSRARVVPPIGKRSTHSPPPDAHTPAAVRARISPASTKSRGYPGTCRAGPTRSGPTALRFRVSDTPIHFDDLFLGAQHFDLATCGDVVVERRDGLASYQLAVVVDDAFQEITRVVRGADLLPIDAVADRSAAGAVAASAYLRTPAAAAGTGRRQTIEIPPRAFRSTCPRYPKALISTLTHLSQAPPPELAHSSIKEVWEWAIAHWNPRALAGKAMPAVRLRRHEAESHRKNCGVQRGVLR